MKTGKQFLIVLTMLSLFLPAVNAEQPSERKTKITNNTISSLLEGIRSDNLGLKTGCAYMLGELKITESVVPLIKILREDKDDEARIAAALALYKINTPLSINAVKQSTKFDESERVSKMALTFYNEYLRKKSRQDEKNIDRTNVAIK